MTSLNSIKISIEILIKACEFSVTRASGPGGQHVNRTNSAVICTCDLNQLEISELDRALLFEKLSHRLIKDQFISVRCEESRDQKSNKDQALKNLKNILEKALFKPKKRIKTKPSYSSTQKRLNSKTKKSVIKKMRQEKF